MTFQRQHVSDTPIARPVDLTGPVVDTLAGKVCGVWRQIADLPGADAPYQRSAAFYGIPYAQTPVGDLRFQAAQARHAWTGEYAATSPAPTPQRKSIFDDPAIPEPSVPGEDVLTLNVFTPQPGNHEAKLPVLVWIHGGGWSSGSHNSPWYDGATFNRDGIVTVSVAYRLGFEGFGYIPDSDAPLNRGLLDQIMALRWVRDNIAAFGGDPARVTIAGQSAGGGNCLVLASMPQAEGLFSSLISQSGAVPDVTVEMNRQASVRLAELLGVPLSGQALKDISADALFEAQNTVLAAAGGPGGQGSDPTAIAAQALAGIGQPSPMIPFAPTVDGDLIPAPIAEAFASGAGGRINILAGSTTHDFSAVGAAYLDAARGLDSHAMLVAAGLSSDIADIFISERPEHEASAALILGDLLSDSLFRFPLVRMLQARARSRAALGENAGRDYVYEFSYAAGQAGPCGAMAGHCMDLPFSFDCLADPYCEHTLGSGAPQALAEAMHGDWVSFIRTGHLPWPQWIADGAGRRYGDNRRGEMVVAEDMSLYRAARLIVDERTEC